MKGPDPVLLSTAVTMAERAQDEAARSKEAAEDYLQQVLDHHGEESEEYAQADELCRAGYELYEATKQAAAEVIARRRPIG